LLTALGELRDADFDAAIVANLPWGLFPKAVAALHRVPTHAMPLWHLEDDFYYWRHYERAIRSCRGVLANTPYSAERFFAPRGIPAVFVGPGVPPAPEPDDAILAAEADLRARLDPAEFRVLVVCRKSPEKRYDLVADAVGRLRAAGRPARMVLVGPDADGRPLPDHVVYLGRVDDPMLEAAYRVSDVLALMSESESFGMVLAEAWLRDLPVVANRVCGPAASLVSEDTDGLLATDAATLADALARLMDDPGAARAMGEAGRRKARDEYLQRAATERLLTALEEWRPRPA
jgi:glycosyltransferase involved in cell wall biosynthesis